MRKIVFGATGFVIVGVIGLYIWINTTDVEAFSFQSVDVKETKDVSTQGVKNILIDSSSIDVNVQPTSGDKIEIEFSEKWGKGVRIYIS